MAIDSSLSKGCFIHKPKQCADPFLNFKTETWDKAFSNIWNDINANVQEFTHEISSQLISSLVDFTKTSELTDSRIPTAVLLTGVNLPDHSSLFSGVVSSLKNDLECGIALLEPSFCLNLKVTVEIMVQELMKTHLNVMEDAMDEDEIDFDRNTKVLPKSACNMPNLLSWFKNRLMNKEISNSYKLVVIIPDFEGMSPKVLHDFLLILSYYMGKLPLVLILGVATNASVIGDILEHSVTSKLLIQIFQSQKSIHILNNVLDKIFLNKDCPIQLGPKIMEFLINTFLFYDFSVQKFTLGIKFCIMDHFFQQPYKILCTSFNSVKNAAKKLSDEDLDALSQLESFKKYMDTLDESERKRLSDKTYLKNCIVNLLMECHKKLENFYLNLKLLKIVVGELPGSPLGKKVRDMYLVAMRGDINKSSGYKECMHLLKFQGKDHLIELISQLISELEDADDFDDVKSKLKQFKLELTELDSKSAESEGSGPGKMTITKNRNEFKEAMIALTKKKRETSFEGIRDRVIDYLMNQLFPAGLKPVTTLPMHEIIVCEATKASCIKRYLVGHPRGDVHHALMNPKQYLLCDCCTVSEPGDIPSTFPDICIAYKLHLECGALINLHDWLQSFAMILDPDSCSEDTEINPLIQARFMQAVSGLEFMGIIKSSKRKVDHVARMTWGGTA